MLPYEVRTAHATAHGSTTSCASGSACRRFVRAPVRSCCGCMQYLVTHAAVRTFLASKAIQANSVAWGAYQPYWRCGVCTHIGLTEATAIGSFGQHVDLHAAAAAHAPGDARGTRGASACRTKQASNGFLQFMAAPLPTPPEGFACKGFARARSASGAAQLARAVQHTPRSAGPRTSQHVPRTSAPRCHPTWGPPGRRRRQGAPYP